MRRLLVLLGVFGLVALGFGLGLLYSLTRTGPLRVNEDAIVADVPRDFVTATVARGALTYLDIQPKASDANTLFIFYPGGLVRPQAYQWLGVALAPLGVRTVIPVLPYDLAVLAPRRAAAILAALEWQGPVVLGGHSLGGAMAARFALEQPEAVDGLVLMGAYSAEGDDLSALGLPTLVLGAERDGLAALAEVEAGLRRLPPGAEFALVPGAVHSFFGRYGPQRGDGTPTVSRAEAEADILVHLRAFFAGF